MKHDQPDWPHDERYDGGDLSCGLLVIDLKRHFDALAAGTRVLVTARDPGAPIDLPAWCRLTGHRLAAQAHPFYFIEVKQP